MSWPSVKTSASTMTDSPTVRLTGNFPQSTRGVMFSMTTRTLLTGGSPRVRHRPTAQGLDATLFANRCHAPAEKHSSPGHDAVSALFLSSSWREEDDAERGQA